MEKLFRIRTITVGVNLKKLDDLAHIRKSISFLEKSKASFEDAGYEVQTIRLALPHLHTLGGLNRATINQLIEIDKLCHSHGLMTAIGDPFAPNTFDSKAIPFIINLIEQTKTISFHTSIASEAIGIHDQSILMAAEVCHLLASHRNGGEANFRYTVSANCPAGIPYFPTAYHYGEDAFGIGLESGNLFQQAIHQSASKNVKMDIISALESNYAPVIKIAEQMSLENQMVYNGLDISTAPGLDSSIGAAIELISGVPFGAASTLSACATITDALQSVPFKTCGYSGLMLPVIEDKVLAQRASEGQYSVKELLLFSTVCGTGLDVVPIPGDTPTTVIAGLYRDMAALSLKYNAKTLSARLFPIPGKKEGDMARFENPYLTDCRVMKMV